MASYRSRIAEDNIVYPIDSLEKLYNDWLVAVGPRYLSKMRLTVQKYTYTLFRISSNIIVVYGFRASDMEDWLEETDRRYFGTLSVIVRFEDSAEADLFYLRFIR